MQLNYTELHNYLSNQTIPPATMLDTIKADCAKAAGVTGALAAVEIEMTTLKACAEICCR